MSRTFQCSEEVAGSSSGGSEGPWNILSPFLKCSATPTIETEKKTALFFDTVVLLQFHCSLVCSCSTNCGINP